MARLDPAKTYATDEDLLTTCPADYGLLVPDHQRQAFGSDGVFAAQAGGSWVLSSAGTPFATLGVKPGQVVRLDQPASVYRTPDLLVADSVAGPALTLRRAGQDAGTGYPPGPAAGLSGVRFAVLSLWPQIEQASYHLNQTFGLDDNVYGRRFSDLYDPRELQRACVEFVLWKQYLDMARQIQGEGNGWYAKAGSHKNMYEAVTSRIEVHLQNMRRGADSVNRQPRVTR